MKVCLHDFHSALELVCTLSKSDGTYVLPAPYGMRVYVGLTRAAMAPSYGPILVS